MLFRACVWEVVCGARAQEERRKRTESDSIHSTQDAPTHAGPSPGRTIPDQTYSNACALPSAFVQPLAGTGTLEDREARRAQGGSDAAVVSPSD